SVTERLNLYDVSNIPDKQALADVMIMLCIRPAEIKNLRISNGGVTGYAKNRGQQDIPREAIFSGQLRDPGKLESTYLRAVFASVAHGPKNASKANTYA
ncbi:19370_t:CDS:2, partial [Gigaspora rosea]